MSNRALCGNAAFGRASLAVTLAAVLGIPLPSVAGIDARDPQSIAVQPPSAPASHSVTTCVDDVNLQGSLRYEVLHAPNNDIIDLTPLKFVCSKITLASQIDVMQDSLLLQGPGSKYLTIDGNDHYRVFKHTGNNVLAIEGLTIANGYYADAIRPSGGCIYSRGSLSLVNSVVSSCAVSSASGGVAAIGGGVSVLGNLTLLSSQIANNHLFAHYGGQANGGGAFVFGNLQSRYSALTDNSAQVSMSGGTAGFGGGAQVYGDVYVANSTIGGNRADYFGGLNSYGQGRTVEIINSTISGNAANVNGGLRFRSPITIRSSTIVFNVSSSSTTVAGVITTSPLILDSSILAYNVSIQGRDDLSASVVTGSNNLVASSRIPLPPLTIATCPRLGPLTYDGGPTPTHLPAHDSPVIDNGDGGSFATDQRLEPRVFGLQADIGSVEVQPDDKDERLLLDGFDGLCDP
jgi:hypothetical protein